MRKPRVLRSLLVTGLTVTVLVLVAWRVDLGEVKGALSSVSPGWLAGAAAVALFFNTVQSAEALRWMLRGYGVRLGFPSCLAATAGNMAIKAALPAGSGEMARVVWLRRTHGVDPDRATVAMATLLWLKLLWLVIIASAGTWMHPGTPLAQSVLLTSCAVGILAVTLLAPRLLARTPVPPRERSLVKDFPRRLRAAMEDRRAGPLIVGSAHALASVTAEMAVFAMLMEAAGCQVDPLRVVGTLPLVIIGAKVPLTLMGLGTREGLVLLLFAGVSPAPLLASVALLFSVVEYLLPALFGGVLTLGYVQRILGPGDPE